jgi:hypothetical protein
MHKFNHSKRKSIDQPGPPVGTYNLKSSIGDAVSPTFHDRPAVINKQTYKPGPQNYDLQNRLNPKVDIAPAHNFGRSKSPQRVHTLSATPAPGQYR